MPVRLEQRSIVSEPRAAQALRSAGVGLLFAVDRARRHRRQMRGPTLLRAFAFAEIFAVAAREAAERPAPRGDAPGGEKRSDASDTVDPFVAKAVIVTAFHGELEGWIRSVPLGEELPFDRGAGDGKLYVNRTLGVFGLMTGEGPARAATSITALGYDARVDVSAAYAAAARNERASRR